MSQKINVLLHLQCIVTFIAQIPKDVFRFFFSSIISCYAVSLKLKVQIFQKKFPLYRLKNHLTTCGRRLKIASSHLCESENTFYKQPYNGMIFRKCFLVLSTRYIFITYLPEVEKWAFCRKHCCTLYFFYLSEIKECISLITDCQVSSMERLVKN